MIETKEKEPLLFKKHSLDALTDHVGLRLDYFGNLFSSEDMFKGIEALCARIENAPLELYSVITEAKKDKGMPIRGVAVYNYQTLLTRVYILMYYLHHDDEGIYSKFVFPELLRNMGIYGKGDYVRERINKEVGLILAQEKMVEEAMKKKKEQRTSSESSTVRIQDYDGSWLTTDEYIKKHPIISTLHIPDTKSLIFGSLPTSPSCIDYEARCSSLEKQNAQQSAEIKKLREQVKQLQQQQQQQRANPATATHTDEEYDRLKAELDDYRSKVKGLTARQTAILGYKLAYHLGVLPSDKKALAPLLKAISGYGQRSLEQKICGYFTEEEEMELANIFGNGYPKIARLIYSKWQGTPVP